MHFASLYLGSKQTAADKMSRKLLATLLIVAFITLIIYFALSGNAPPSGIKRKGSGRIADPPIFVLGYCYCEPADCNRWSPERHSKQGEQRRHMMERTVLRSPSIAAFVMASPAACAAGRDKVISNPNPDRTWGRTIGGVFTSGRSIAVVIGISNYIGERAGGYPVLPTAKHDADKMADFLIKDAGFDTVYVLTDERATKSRIDVLMTDVIPGVVTPRDRFLFYWSGHGEQRFNADIRAFGFLPPASTESKEFSAMVSMQDLERRDRYLDAPQAPFVLDAGLSGLAGYQTKAPQNTRLEQLSLPSRHLLTAGTKDEASSRATDGGQPIHGFLYFGSEGPGA